MTILTLGEHFTEIDTDGSEGLSFTEMFLYFEDGNYEISIFESLNLILAIHDTNRNKEINMSEIYFEGEIQSESVVVVQEWTPPESGEKVPYISEISDVGPGRLVIKLP